MIINTKKLFISYFVSIHFFLFNSVGNNQQNNNNPMAVRNFILAQPNFLQKFLFNIIKFIILINSINDEGSKSPQFTQSIISQNTNTIKENNIILPTTNILPKVVIRRKSPRRSISRSRSRSLNK